MVKRVLGWAFCYFHMFGRQRANTGSTLLNLAQHSRSSVWKLDRPPAESDDLDFVPRRRSGKFSDKWRMFTAKKSDETSPPKRLLGTEPRPLWRTLFGAARVHKDKCSC